MSLLLKRLGNMVEIVCSPSLVHIVRLVGRWNNRVDQSMNNIFSLLSLLHFCNLLNLENSSHGEKISVIEAL